MAVHDWTSGEAGKFPASAAKPPRRRMPKQLAVIDADSCTGCEACVEVCPVDCIELRQFGDGVKGTQAWFEVDLERCIGCELCIRLPRKDRADPYLLLICPWDAIEMIPADQAAQAVARTRSPE
jgi:Na+-translocating ferredoxin:NAD+ oxidoreductase subunit B